jgi:hypothetical protein
MVTLALKFLRPIAPYLAAVALLLAAVLYVATLRHDLAVAKDKNITLAALNAANAAAIADYKTQQAKWNSALDTLDAQTLDANTAAGRIVAKINAGPASSDGPVAPVLTEALNSLRALQGDAP